MHPATTSRRDSGFRHREHLDIEESPHLQRFFLVERVLLIYLTVKLKIFLGSVP